MIPITKTGYKKTIFWIEITGAAAIGIIVSTLYDLGEMPKGVFLKQLFKGAALPLTLTIAVIVGIAAAVTLVILSILKRKR